jgi:adenylate cyclase
LCDRCLPGRLPERGVLTFHALWGGDMPIDPAQPIDRLRESLANSYIIDRDRELGRGGMSSVFLAQDCKHDRLVAIKVLHPELAASLGPDRFLREIKLAARLSHPHILPLFDSGEANGLLYYVMPYVDGESLRQKLDREQSLSVDESVRHGCAIASALDYANRLGVIHRDVKPENVMIYEGVAMVMDFGIAKAVSSADSSTLTQAGMMVGTPAYVSPEQASGEFNIDGRSDQYSLACVVYEMLSGELPFQGGNAQAIMVKRLTGSAKPLRAVRSGVSENIERAVAKAMSTDPAGRFSSSTEFAQALASGRVSPPGDTGVLATSMAGSVAVLRSADKGAGRNALSSDSVAGQIVGGGRQRSLPSTARRWIGAALAPLLVIAAAMAWTIHSPRTTQREVASVPPPAMAADRPSVAVLPFVSLDDDPENAYFADGITDDIITDLSKLSGILVVARNSSWTFKGKAVKVQQVADDLGVRYVVEGSVRRVGETIRINAHLVDAHAGNQLWAARYDGSIGDVFALQDKVVGQVVDALAVKLSHDEQARFGLAETQIPQAYDAVLRGLAHYRQDFEAETLKAIALFEQAVALDPGYSRAHAALAAAFWRIVQSSWESTTEGGYQRSIDRMQAALVEAKRQPNALSHAVSAELRTMQGRYPEAFAEIDRAMALAPNDPDIHLSKARILNATGRAAQAEESVRWAMRLDPLPSPAHLRVLAVSLFHQQRYQESVATIERALALQSDTLEDYITLIASLGHLGRTSGIGEATNAFNEMSTAAGYNVLNVQSWGGWWWYGDQFNYHPAYRDHLMEGLRKAGVPEGAGTDIPFEEYRRLIRKTVDGYFEVDGATTIDLRQASALHDRGVKFVDVRAAKGFASGHVPGAFNLDAGTELSRESLSRIVGKDEEFVLSCHGKTCPDSAYASAKAVKWGFKGVYYFSAGFPAWEEAGYPIEAAPEK